MRAQEFLNELCHDDIVAAIRDAERRTSGELRVFVSHQPVDDPVSAAMKEFVSMDMEKTREHNGVLIFVAPHTNNFAVIGDSGVHEKVGQTFWTELAAVMSDRFHKGEFTPGLLHAIHKAGDLLARHFPRKPDDRNELPDTVERG